MTETKPDYDTGDNDLQQQSSFERGYQIREHAAQYKVAVPLLYIDLCDGNMYDAILFSQIMYWHGKSKTGKPRLTIKRDGHMWLAKQYDEWWDECRVKASTARRSVSRLVEKGLIVTRVFIFNNKTTLHIRVDWDRFKELVEETLQESERHESTDGNDTRDHSEMTLEHSPSYTDTTSETTADTKEYAPDGASASTPQNDASPEQDAAEKLREWQDEHSELGTKFEKDEDTPQSQDSEEQDSNGSAPRKRKEYDCVVCPPEAECPTCGSTGKTTRSPKQQEQDTMTGLWGYLCGGAKTPEQFERLGEIDKGNYRRVAKEWRKAGYTIQQMREFVKWFRKEHDYNPKPKITTAKSWFLQWLNEPKPTRETHPEQARLLESFGVKAPGADLLQLDPEYIRGWIIETMIAVQEDEQDEQYRVGRLVQDLRYGADVPERARVIGTILEEHEWYELLMWVKAIRTRSEADSQPATEPKEFMSVWVREAWPRWTQLFTNGPHWQSVEEHYMLRADRINMFVAPELLERIVDIDVDEWLWEKQHASTTVA